MKEDPKFKTSENLNDTNFEPWEFMIKFILRSEGIDSYIESDVIGDLTTKIERTRETKNSDNKIIKDLETKLAEARTKDALATTIIGRLKLLTKLKI